MTFGRSVVEVVILFAAALTALGVIGKYVVRWVRGCIHFFLRVDKALTNVEAQLYPNGGASLRDAVNRIQYAIGVQDIPSRGKATDQAHAGDRANVAHAPDRQPPSRLLARLDNLETRTQAVDRTADMETQSLADGRTEVILEAVNPTTEP